MQRSPSSVLVCACQRFVVLVLFVYIIILCDCVAVHQRDLQEPHDRGCEWKPQVLLFSSVWCQLEGEYRNCGGATYCTCISTT